MKLNLFTDWGSRWNPWIAGCGIYITDENFEPLKKWYRFLGETTNNIAEYTAIKIWIEKCIELGATEIDLFADSELAIRQLSWEYKIKNENLKKIFIEIQEILANWNGKITFNHIPREKNKEADRLSNVAMDKGSEK